MNRSFVAVLLAALCGLVWGENRALGQFGPQPGISVPPLGGGPALSPYINLLRNTPALSGVAGQTALNYYGLTQPAFGFYNMIGGLQQQVGLNQQLIVSGLGGNMGIPLTGHPAGFLNSGMFFLTFTRGGMRGGGFGMRGGGFGMGGGGFGMGGGGFGMGGGGFGMGGGGFGLGGGGYGMGGGGFGLGGGGYGMGGGGFGLGGGGFGLGGGGFGLGGGGYGGVGGGGGFRR